MSSSEGAPTKLDSPLPVELPPPSTSLRDERKRTVLAVTSKEARAEPLWSVHMRGPPVFWSGVNRPSTSTLEPFLTYWLQTSACLPQVVTRNQIVSFTCSPLLDVYWRLVAT